MKKINIYVEGNEKKFIEQLISNLQLEDHVEFEVFYTNGKDRIYGKEYPKLLSINTDKEEANLLIFDSDKQDIDQRKKEILQKVTDLNAQFKLNIKINDIFLLPNDLRLGCFETLLFEIMNPEHRDKIFDCLEKYQTCVKEQHYCPTNEKQRDKAKVYAYLEALDYTTPADFPQMVRLYNIYLLQRKIQYPCPASL